MATNFTEIQDGDTVDLAAYLAMRDNLRDTLNDLDSRSVRRNTLHDKHLPSVVVEPGFSDMVGVAPHAYANLYPGWNTAAGWAPIVSGGQNLTATFATPVDLSRLKTKGILVLADVLVASITTAAGAGKWRALAVFTIQAVDSVGAVFPIARSERFIDNETDDDGNIGPGVASADDLDKVCPIATLIRATDVGANPISSVRMVVSVWDASGILAPVTVTLGDGTITAVALQAGSL